jgi:hypothetical protein
VLLLRHFGASYGVRIAAKLLFSAGYMYLGMNLNILTQQNYLLVKNILSSKKAILNVEASTE